MDRSRRHRGGAAKHHRRSPRLCRLWMESLDSRRLLNGGPNRWHVDDSGSPHNGGLSWADAITLQAALGRAVSGDEIWVAAGTYKQAWRRGPDHPAIRRVVEILRRAADEIEREWERPAGEPAPERSA